MTRTIGGTTMSNDGREYFVEQQLRDVAGPTGAMTFIHFQVVADPWVKSSPSNDNAGFIGRIREGYAPKGIPAMPEQLVHVRFYTQYVEDVEPEEWAARIAHMLTHAQFGFGPDSHMRPYDLSQDPFVAVSVYNETNLWAEHKGASEGDQWQFATPESYAEQAERELRVFRKLDELLPARRCLWAASASAPGHDPLPDDPDSEGEFRKPLYDYCDLVQLHVYAELNRYPQSGPDGSDAYWFAKRPFRPEGYRDALAGGDARPHDRGGLVVQYPQYKYLITEYNTFLCDSAKSADIKRVQDALDGMMQEFVRWPRVIGATTFISYAGSMHKQNVLLGNSTALRDWYLGYKAPACHPDATVPAARWQQVVPPLPEPPVPENPCVVGPGLAVFIADKSDEPLTDEISLRGPYGHGRIAIVGGHRHLFFWIEGADGAGSASCITLER